MELLNKIACVSSPHGLGLSANHKQKLRCQPGSFVKDLTAIHPTNHILVDPFTDSQAHQDPADKHNQAVGPSFLGCRPNTRHHAI
jgi:hypothetical protein